MTTQAESKTTTRRHMMVAGAALAAVPFPASNALAAGPDPLFAAIERHRRAGKRVKTAIDAFEEAELRYPERDLRGWWNFYDEGEPDGDEPADWLSTNFDLRDAWDEYHAALDEVFTTTPTTIAGAVAVLEYTSADEFGDGSG
jgi:hypothetical protein